MSFVATAAFPNPASHCAESLTTPTITAVTMQMVATTTIRAWHRDADPRVEPGAPDVARFVNGIVSFRVVCLIRDAASHDTSRIVVNAIGRMFEGRGLIYSRKGFGGTCICGRYSNKSPFGNMGQHVTQGSKRPARRAGSRGCFSLYKPCI